MKVKKEREFVDSKLEDDDDVEDCPPVINLLSAIDVNIGQYDLIFTNDISPTLQNDKNIALQGYLTFEVRIYLTKELSARGSVA